MQYRIACQPDEIERYWDGYNWTLDYDSAKIYHKIGEAMKRTKYLTKFCYDYVNVVMLHR